MVDATQGRSERLTYIKLQDLRFDPTNPRIIESLGESPSQESIQRLLLGGEMKARELIPSFVENGYLIYEPLIVRPNRGVYIVVEGNRRLAALKLMAESDDPEEKGAFTRHNLNEIPCIIFDGDDKELLAYLGLRHLSKTKDWSTNAKGAFVERVLRSGHSLKEAGRLTNTTTNSLRLILLTRRLFEEAGSLGLDLPSSGAEGETIFWHLGDAIRRTRTKNYLELQENPDPLQQPAFDETKFEYLVSWLYGSPKTGSQRVISSIRDIKTLDECLGNHRAIQALETGASLPEAHEELQAAGESVIGHLDRARRSVGRAMQSLSELDGHGVQQVEHAFIQLSNQTKIFSLALDAQKNEIDMAADTEVP
jgi:ParB-like chromosome segregation protein Spo0J